MDVKAPPDAYCHARTAILKNINPSIIDDYDDERLQQFMHHGGHRAQAADRRG